MNVLGVIAWVVGLPTLGYFAWSSVALAVGAARTARRLRRATDESHRVASRAVHWVVLLPMLREDRVVDATCEHLARAADDGLDLEVVIAVNARERVEQAAAVTLLSGADTTTDQAALNRALELAVLPEAQDAYRTAVARGDGAAATAMLSAQARPTTAQAATKTIERLNAGLGRAVFRLVEAPAAAEGKVGQLNVALSTVVPARDRPTYVAVYDADSTPDLSTFTAVEAIVTERRRYGRSTPAIFQQVSCYCQRLTALRGWRLLLGAADAVAQTRWAMGFEFDLYRRYVSRIERGRTRPLVYCIGHGCIVAWDHLQRVDGFPTLSPNDDLALGYQASLLGAEVYPVPTLDYCDVAPDPLSSIRQSRFWFLGSARFAQDLRAFRVLPGISVSRWQWWTLLWQGYGRAAAWSWRAAAWCVAFLLALVAGPAWLAVGLGVAHLSYVQFGFAQTVWHLRRLPPGDRRGGVAEIRNSVLCAAAAIASVSFVLRSLGPLLGSLSLLRRNPEHRLWKVER